MRVLPNCGIVALKTSTTGTCAVSAVSAVSTSSSTWNVTSLSPKGTLVWCQVKQTNAAFTQIQADVRRRQADSIFWSARWQNKTFMTMCCYGDVVLFTNKKEHLFHIGIFGKYGISLASRGPEVFSLCSKKSDKIKSRVTEYTTLRYLILSLTATQR